jgi:hypothetical protein
MGLKLNGTHQLLAYADNVYLLGDNTGARNKNTKPLIYSSMEVGLEVKEEISKYILVYRDQNTQQSLDIKIGNR